MITAAGFDTDADTVKAANASVIEDFNASLSSNPDPIPQAGRVKGDEVESKKYAHDEQHIY